MQNERADALSLNLTRTELAKRIFDSCHLTGEFTLRSGAVSHAYFDKYQFETDPKLLQAIASELARLVPEGTEILAGLEMGGIPIATALSLSTGLPCAFVRKEAKSYGTQRICEGPAIDGRSLTIVEDVVTSGGQVLLSTEELRSRGAEVSTVLCVIDRGTDTNETLNAAGLSLRALFTADELGQASESRS